MEAVVISLTNTPASEVTAMTMGLDFLISFFYFGLSAVAPSPLAPGPSSSGAAAPRHPAPDLNLLDLQLLDHGFPAP